jgi:hypothetical protein
MRGRSSRRAPPVFGCMKRSFYIHSLRASYSLYRRLRVRGPPSIRPTPDPRRPGSSKVCFPSGMHPPYFTAGTIRRSFTYALRRRVTPAVRIYIYTYFTAGTTRRTFTYGGAPRVTPAVHTVYCRYSPQYFLPGRRAPGPQNIVLSW